MGTRRSNRKKRRRILFGSVIAAGIIVIAAYAAFSSYMEKESKAVLPGSTDYVPVTIPSGSGTERIAEILQENDLISSVWVFKLRTKSEGLEGKYQAGQYFLSPGMNMLEIMDTLLSGKADTLRFTVPEGYDIRRVTEKLAAEGLVDAEVFTGEIESGAFDYWFLEDAPAGPDRLEGFLFPETYEIFAMADEHDIIDKMLYQFSKVFTDEYKARADELGMSVREVVTLASIIEREALIQKDRPVIASVFYNRLGIDMPLQSCATVQYILGEQKPVLSIEDTRIESPYNTYLYTGLPPGPIASPGADSIKAALYPEDTAYLFFLAKGDGSHAFSETYEQFLRDKARYID